MKKKTRIGILLNDRYISAWAYAMVSDILESDVAEISLLVFNKRNKRKNNYFSPSIFTGAISRFYKKFDRHGFRATQDAFELKDIDTLLNVEKLFVQIKGNDEKDSFPEEIVKKIEEYNIDILIKLGFRDLSGGILQATKYGVWSIMPEDDKMITDSLPGFWEVMQQHDESVISLQILKENKVNNKILFSSTTLTDKLSIERNNNKNFWKASTFIRREIDRLNHLGEKDYCAYIEKLSGISNLSAGYNSNKNNLKMIWEIFKLQLRRAKNILLAKFYFDQWILLFKLGESNQINIDLDSFIKMIPPKDRFWADPQVIKKGKIYYIFLEELKFKENKGFISVIEMDENGNYSSPVKILEEDYHLSYPYIFEEQDQIYMIPESRSNKKIQLYKCINFPYKWALEKVLMDNVRAVDTTITYKNSKYWMFTNIAKFKGVSSNDELHLFSSDNLLSDHWVPHPNNPISSDVKNARSAGRLFMRGKKLYRPAQNCSRRYGYGLQINEVIKLDMNDYKEKLVTSIFPDEKKNMLAIHTLSSTENLTLIDAQLRRRK